MNRAFPEAAEPDPGTDFADPDWQLERREVLAVDQLAQDQHRARDRQAAGQLQQLLAGR